MRPGVGLAAWWSGDVGVADTIPNGMSTLERPGQIRKHDVLRILEWPFIRTLEFDADRKVIATATSTPLGLAGMPGALCARHKLDQFTVAPDQKMAGDPEPGDLAIIRMRIRIELIGEQMGDPRPAELPRRQADVVDHKEFDTRALRAVVAVR